MNRRLALIGLGGSLLVTGTVLSCQVTSNESSMPAPEATQPRLETSENATVDTLSLPPMTRTMTSSDGRYSFIVQAKQGWESDQVSGRLSHNRAEGTQRLWQHDLPHSYGPRFVVVGPQGQVLLLDEAINVASPYAVMLLDDQGEVIAQHSFDDIETTLGVHRADIVEQAEHGWWISAPPEVNEATGQVTVATGGKTLIIDLTSGQLGL